MGIFKCDEVLAIINYNRRAVRFCQSEAAPHGKIFCNAVSHFFTCVCALLSVNIFFNLYKTSVHEAIYTTLRI